MSVVAAIRDLIAKGFTVEQALTAAEAFEPVRPVRSAAAERQAKYRANGGGKIPLELREEVFERDGFICVYCGSEEYLQCDHVVPVSKGGDTSLENLATACRVCNAKKKDRDRKAFVRDLRNSKELPRNSLEHGEAPPSVSPPRDINSTPPSTPPAKPRREKPRTALAEEAQPTKADVAAAVADGLSMGDVRAEWQAYRDFHRSKGNLMADWSAAWRTWLRNRKRFSPGARAGPRSQDSLGGFHAVHQEILDAKSSDHCPFSPDLPTAVAGVRHSACGPDEQSGTDAGWGRVLDLRSASPAR